MNNQPSVLAALKAGQDAPLSPETVREAVAALRQRIGDPPAVYRNSRFLIGDPLFIFRGDPAYVHHDPLGYKNEAFPPRLDILCLGNSQVHSLYDPAATTWPALLGGLAGCQAYNAAMGSFSAVQNLLSLRELLFTRPRLVIMTFYTGNNVFNGLRTLQGGPHLRGEFEPCDLKLRPAFQNPDKDVVLGPDARLNIEKFFEATRSGVTSFATAAIGEVTHFLTPTLRYQVQDLADPYVAAGFAVGCQAMVKMFDLVRREGIPLFVFPLPTKEYLVYRRARRRGDVALSATAELDRLGEIESGAIEAVADLCRAHGVPVLDIIDRLADEMHTEVYRQLSTNSHPHTLGKQLIARFLADDLKRLPATHLAAGLPDAATDGHPA